MIVGDCMQYPNLPDKHLVARARDALTKWCFRRIFVCCPGSSPVVHYCSGSIPLFFPP